MRPATLPWLPLLAIAALACSASGGGGPAPYAAGGAPTGSGGFVGSSGAGVGGSGVGGTAPGGAGGTAATGGVADNTCSTPEDCPWWKCTCGDGTQFKAHACGGVCMPATEAHVCPAACKDHGGVTGYEPLNEGGAGGTAGGVGGSGAGGGAGVGGGSGAYPPGPYGFDKGDIIDGNICLPGYLKGGAQGTVCIKDYYDPDGARGIDALVIMVSAGWCGVCKAQNKAMPWYVNGSGSPQNGPQALYKNLKIEFLESVVDDVSGAPATVQFVGVYRSQYDPTGLWPWLADGARRIPLGSTTPRNYIIDTRKMQIWERFEGWGDGVWQAPEILAKFHPPIQP